jgi:hypothetical protein
MIVVGDILTKHRNGRTFEIIREYRPLGTYRQFVLMDVLSGEEVDVSAVNLATEFEPEAALPVAGPSVDLPTVNRPVSRFAALSPHDIDKFVFIKYIFIC